MSCLTLRFINYNFVVQNAAIWAVVKVHWEGTSEIIY